MMTIPNNWAQLTAKQAFSVVKYTLEGKNIASKMRILEAILPLEVLPIYTQLKANQIQTLLPLVDWTFQKPITTPHLQYFVIDDVKFFLPDTAFKNVHLIEYSYATDAYNDLLLKNKSAINRLIACLCRPEKLCDKLSPDYNGDPREKFNPELLEHYASLIQHLPVEFKCYFIKYFESCADYIVEQFRPLFTPTHESSEAESNRPNFGWLGFIMALADTSVFGNFEQTQYTNIYTALAYRLKKFYDEKDLK